MAGKRANTSQLVADGMTYACLNAWEARDSVHGGMDLPGTDSTMPVKRSYAGSTTTSVTTRDTLKVLNGLDLFSGIGGISIALQEWVKPITYCESDAYCQAVLLSRMADGALYNATIWDDITTLDGAAFSGCVDIIYGGFPCQDISIAGNGAGLAG